MSFMNHLAGLSIVLSGLYSKDNLLTLAVDTNSTLLAETNALGAKMSLPMHRQYE